MAQLFVIRADIVKPYSNQRASQYLEYIKFCGDRITPFYNWTENRGSNLVKFDNIEDAMLLRKIVEKFYPWQIMVEEL